MFLEEITCLCYIYAMSRVMEKTVEDTISRCSMLEKGDTVIVALSGGPDSVCLLHVLEQLRARFSLTLYVAHFNHRLRPEAAEDEEFAEKTATRMSLPFLSSSADVRSYAKEEGLSIEDAARRLRYEFLLRSAKTVGAKKVAVGHNADDQAETVLMRLIRGSGPHGLAGIPPVRRLGDARGPRIIRPLLEVWRSDIMRYLAAHKMQYRKDESNDSAEFFRNKIRLQLLPSLEDEYNPKIKQRLAAAASALAIENDFMESEAQIVAEEIILERKSGWVVFNATLLASLHSALRKRVLLALTMLAKSDASMLEALHYSEADTILRSGRGRLDLPGGLKLEVSEGAGLISVRSRSRTKARKVFDVAIDGSTLITDLGMRIKTTVIAEIKSPDRLVRMCTPNRQYFDLDAVRPPIEVRFRRPGDSFRPLGSGGSKKLKDYFIDRKVPRFLRDCIPLLISNGRIMWVMGYAIDNRYRLKPGSSAAFRVDYE
jgi:tRNA(Ile)-lysidine synthase